MGRNLCEREVWDCCRFIGKTIQRQKFLDILLSHRISADSNSVALCWTVHRCRWSRPYDAKIGNTYAIRSGKTLKWNGKKKYWQTNQLLEERKKLEERENFHRLLVVVIVLIGFILFGIGTRPSRHQSDAQLLLLSFLMLDPRQQSLNYEWNQMQTWLINGRGSQDRQTAFEGIWLTTHNHAQLICPSSSEYI